MSPRPRFQTLSDERRRAILDAAGDEFAEHGYDDASYNRIIERAGVSKGAMYYWFDDKLDLFITVIEDLIGGVLAQIPEPPPPPDAQTFFAQMEAQALASLHHGLVAPRTAALFKSIMRARHTLRGDPRFRALYAVGGGRLERVFTQGQAVGAVRDDLPIPLMAGLWMGVDEVLDVWVAEQFDVQLSPEDFPRIASIYLDIFVRLLATPAALGEHFFPRRDE